MLYRNGWNGNINYPPKFGVDNTTTVESTDTKEKTKVCQSCKNSCLCSDIFCSKCGEKL